MGYGKIAVDTLRWDNAGTPTDLDVGTLATPSDLNGKANVASPTFTGDVTLTGASYNVVFDASDNALEFADNAKATFGTGSDLEIYHDGTYSYLKNNTSQLRVQSATFGVQKTDGSEAIIWGDADGAVALYQDGVQKLSTSTDGVVVSGSVTDDKGDLRSIPQNAKTANYTLVEADAGKHILCNTASITITYNPNTFDNGDAITVVNNTTGDINIHNTAGTNMQSTLGNGNRVLASRGMATILTVDDSATGTGYISGAGLS